MGQLQNFTFYSKSFPDDCNNNDEHGKRAAKMRKKLLLCLCCQAHRHILRTCTCTTFFFLTVLVSSFDLVSFVIRPRAIREHQQYRMEMHLHFRCFFSVRSFAWLSVLCTAAARWSRHHYCCFFSHIRSNRQFII